jgi:2,3-bisphosphoglycerate-independent phosphoglycerate mutase
MTLTPLKPLTSFKPRQGPVLLIVMDGVGLGPDVASNAVYMANMPFLNNLKTSGLYRTLRAHGKAVGMPSDEDMGNSEVGHNALGAGRIFDQGAALVKEAVESGKLFEGTVWKSAINNVLEKKSTLHFLGLLSDGNVHAHINHLITMIQEAAKAGVKRIRIHTLLDGRDVAEKSALIYLEKLESSYAALNNTGYDIAIASGGGRMITTMDRYNADWDIVKRGWDAHVLGIARPFASAKQAVETLYTEDPKVTDQYLPSFTIIKDGLPVGPIVDYDSVIFFNFRGDRAIELSIALESHEFSRFDRQRKPDIYFAGMMQYDGDLKIPTHFLVNPPSIENPLSVYLCDRNITSFAISETQKYGHVTYFWNGNKSGYINQNLESYVEIPSDRIPFDQAPAMKAYEITEKTIELLRAGTYKFGRLNFPNGDMVGHTGVMEAAVKACEVTDICVQKLVETVNELGGVTVILADHGNADEMYTEKNGVKTPKTAHTLNPVPFAIVDSGYVNDYSLRTDLPTAGLANVAATVCNLLGYEQPGDYEPSLIEFR